MVLLFGEETWVLTPGMEQALSIFHLRVVQWLIRRQMRIRGGSELGLSYARRGNEGIRI